MLLVLAVLFPSLFAASVSVPVFPSELSWVAAVEFFANNQHLTGETRLFVDAKNERERVDTVMNGEGFGSTEILLPKQSLVYAIQWSDKSMTNGTCMMRKQSFPYKPFQLPSDVKYQGSGEIKSVPVDHWQAPFTACFNRVHCTTFSVNWYVSHEQSGPKIVMQNQTVPPSPALYEQETTVSWVVAAPADHLFTIPPGIKCESSSQLEPSYRRI
jgi:hypothetical protein